MLDNASIKKAEWVASLSLVVTIFFGIIDISLAAWNGVEAVFILGWLFIASASIWLVVLLHLRQKRLAQEEELAESQMPPEQNTLFDKEEIDPFSARSRLGNFEKWVAPVITLGLGLVFIAFTLYSLVKYSRYGIPQATSENHTALMSASFQVGLAFFSLLLSKYALGMAKQQSWRLLRAGGSFLFLNAAMAFICAIVLLISHPILQLLFSYAMVLIWAGVGIEMIVNLILDIYRPRVREQEVRPSYDSRFLELCTGSQGVLHTVAQAIDYQFGFQVSKTWFYRFLEKAVAPLLLFLIATLVFLDCILVIGPGQQGIVERFGRPIHNKPLEAGLYIKWPRPIEYAYLRDSMRFGEVHISSHSKKSEISHGHHHREESDHEAQHIIFTQPHGEDTEYFLVAHSVYDPQLAAKTIPADLFAIDVYLRYYIDDLFAYDYNHSAPHELVEMIGYKVVTRYLASLTRTGKEVIGKNRLETAEILKKMVQKECDKRKIGIRIAFLGILEIHPPYPAQVAESYEKTIAAMEEKRTKILAAQNYRMQIEPIARAEAKKLTNTANIYLYEQQMLTAAEVDMFKNQLAAYRAGGKVFLLRQYLRKLEQHLGRKRLYILNVRELEKQVNTLDLTEPLGIGELPEIEITDGKGNDD